MGDLIIGCYVYLDGEAHVRVVLACDAVIQGMCEKRKAAIAFLCTPTDLHVIPEEARKEAMRLFFYVSAQLGDVASSHSLWQEDVGQERATHSHRTRWQDLLLRGWSCSGPRS